MVCGGGGAQGVHNKHTPHRQLPRTLSSLVLSSGQHAWEVLGEVLVVEVLVVEHAVEVSAPVVEPLGEKEEEEEGGEGMQEDKKKGSSFTSDIAPRQVPVLQQAMPVGPGF